MIASISFFASSFQFFSNPLLRIFSLRLSFSFIYCDDNLISFLAVLFHFTREASELMIHDDTSDIFNPLWALNLCVLRFIFYVGASDTGPILFFYSSSLNLIMKGRVPWFEFKNGIRTNLK